MRPILYSSSYPLDRSGKTLVTALLQDLVDQTARLNGILVLEKGIYLTGPLFLKSNMELVLEEGSILKATTDEMDYPLVFTRVAGIEMPWYPALLNCIGQEHITIRGNGMIDGSGPYWWEKYWGKDKKGGMRQVYDRQGLRWACDYDCKRLRNVLIQDSSFITLKEFTSYQAGFWNVHLLYSKEIHVDGIQIRSHSVFAPRTDGIDVDSCCHVLIENCLTECHDDSICIKSGRDQDGWRVGRKTADVTIRNCTILAGFGVTIGSEISGGVENIHIHHIRFEGSDCGFRIKSSLKRGGYIKNISVHDLTMLDVMYPFHFFLDWNRAYSTCTLPKDYDSVIPDHWKILLQPANMNKTSVENILIERVEATCSKQSRAFHLIGYPDQRMKNIRLKDCKITCSEFGILRFVEDLTFSNVSLTITDQNTSSLDEYDQS